MNLAGANLATALWLTYIDPTKTLNDVETLAKDPEIIAINETARISFQLILAAQSVDGIQLQDKILNEILSQTGCYKVERYCEPDMAEFTNMYMQRLGHKHCNFIWAGGYMGSWMQAGTPDFVKNYVPTAIKGFEEDQQSHLLVECGGDALMGCGSTLGGGGYFGLEQFVSYDPASDASIDACIKHMEDAIADCVAQGLPLGKELLVPADRLDRPADLGRHGQGAADLRPRFPETVQGRGRSELSRRPQLSLAAGEVGPSAGDCAGEMRQSRAADCRPRRS